MPALERACKGKSRHVVIVGVDGLRADSIQPADTPTFDAMIAEGTATLEGYAGGELGGATEQPTVSGPGWATVLTGTWANRHNVVDNEFAQWELEEPHFFNRIHEADPDARLTSIQQWIPISILVDGSADRDEIGSGGQVEEYAIDEVTNHDPAVVFLHFDAVDAAGHDTGYGPDAPDYLPAVESVDAHAAAVLEAVDKRPTRADECWATILITDHGGIETNHGGQTPEERTIPIVVAGDGIEAETVTDGPGHDVVAPTVLAYLGLAIDESWGWAEPFGVQPAQRRGS